MIEKEQKKFICKNCPASYTTLAMLQKHVKITHVKNGLYSHLSEYYDKYFRTNEKEGICPVTGEKTSFIGFKDGYRKYLNDRVCHKDPEYMNNMKQGVIDAYGQMSKEKKQEMQNKRYNTNLERYGGTSPMASKEVVERHQQRNLEKYGVKSVMQLKEVKEKLMKTLTDKYGGVGYGSEITKQKIIDTNLERYGVECYSQTEKSRTIQSKRLKEYYQTEEGKNEKIKRFNTYNERYGGILGGSKIINEKSKITNLERYGTEFPIQNTIIKEKQSNTLFERYGTRTPGASSEVIKLKMQKTIKDKYNVENISQLDWVREKIINTVREKYGVINVLQMPEHTVKRNFVLKIYVTKFGNEITYNSKQELEFIELCELKNIYIEDGPTLLYEHNGKHRHYVVDFRIKKGDKYQLIEIKDYHKWWYEDLLDGTALSKVLVAQTHSVENNFLPYKILFKNKMKKFFNGID